MRYVIEYTIDTWLPLYTENGEVEFDSIDEANEYCEKRNTTFIKYRVKNENTK